MLAATRRNPRYRITRRITGRRCRPASKSSHFEKSKSKGVE